MSPGIEYMEDGLPDPVKAMGRLLVENINTDPGWRWMRLISWRSSRTIKRGCR